MPAPSPPGIPHPGHPEDAASEAAAGALHVAVVRRYAEEVWNRGAFGACDELFRPGHTYHDPLFPLLGQGPEGVRQHHIAYAQAIPDVYVTIEEIHAFADRVLARWTASGTHRGPLKGVAPTGRHAHIAGMNLFRFVRGQIAETWVFWDALGLFQQLGAVAPFGPASEP